MARARALLVDLGGTQLRLARTRPAGGVEPLAQLPSAQVRSLGAALLPYAAGCDRLVLAVAGAVHGPRLRLTNLALTVDAAALGEQLSLRRVTVVNDLVAHGVGLLSGGPVRPLGGRRPLDLGAGAIAVLAPGTGLGEAAFERGVRANFRVRASEGGHAPMPVLDAQSLRFCDFLRAQLGRGPSAEDALAGHGLSRAYQFLAHNEGLREPLRCQQRVREASDPNREVLQLAAAGEGKAAPAALTLYVRLLAHEARSLCLKHGAFGGVLLAGGLSVALRDALLAHDFRRQLAGEGPFAAALRKLPLAVAAGAESALDGCAVLASSRGAAEVVEPSAFGLSVWSAPR